MSDNSVQHLGGFADHLKNKGRLPTTVESYRRDASRFLNYLASLKLLPNRVEPSNLVHYQEYLRDDCKEKENTVRRAVIGVRQFYRYLQDQGVIKQSPFDLVPIPERNEALPELDTEAVEQLIAKVSHGVHNLISARNAAIVCLIGIEGLKATEIIAMNWNDLFLDATTATAVVRGTKARTIKLSPETSSVLKSYRSFYKPYQNHPNIRSSSENRLMIAFKGRDASLLIPHMTRHGLKFIVYEMGTAEGINHLNTELLRHYAVTRLITSGRSAEEIMDHLGLRRLGNIAKHMSAQRRLNAHAADH